MTERQLFMTLHIAKPDAALDLGKGKSSSPIIYSRRNYPVENIDVATARAQTADTKGVYMISWRRASPSLSGTGDIIDPVNPPESVLLIDAEIDERMPAAMARLPGFAGGSYVVMAPHTRIIRSTDWVVIWPRQPDAAPELAMNGPSP